MIRKDIELGSRGFTFADEITHAQLELVRKLESVDLDIASEYVSSSALPILQEEEKRRVLLGLLENALEVVELVKEAKKHISALEMYSISGAVEQYINRIVEHSFIQFQDPNNWDITEYNQPELVAGSTNLQSEQSFNVEPGKFQKIKQMRAITLRKLNQLFHKDPNQRNQDKEPKNTIRGRASTSKGDQLRQQAEMAEIIADPLIWLEYNLTQILMAIETIKKQIGQLRKNTIEQMAQLTVDQMNDLSILLGSEELRGIHTTNVLHRHPSDLLIQ